MARRPGLRRDSKHRVLRRGESIRADGKYQFKYHVNGKPHFVYSWRLEPTDKLRVGKKPCLSLRELEKQIGYDLDSLADPVGKNITVEELVERYLMTKTGVKPNTLANYKFVQNLLKTQTFSGKKISAVKTSDAKFKESISEWKKLRDILPNNDYVVQQLALVQYKSKYPNVTLALGEALNTIQSLNPKKSLDLETIGITGAIYKNLFKLNKNYDYLDEAINYYKKGFIIKNDYYNGENYSNCLLLKTQKPDLEVEEVEYLKFESKKVCREIISLLEESIRDNEINYWMYATLATCYLCLKDEKNYQKYEAEFLANTTIEWEIETYKNTIADTKKILMIE